MLIFCNDKGYIMQIAYFWIYGMNFKIILLVSFKLLSNVYWFATFFIWASYTSYLGIPKHPFKMVLKPLILKVNISIV